MIERLIEPVLLFGQVGVAAKMQLIEAAITRLCREKPQAQEEEEERRRRVAVEDPHESCQRKMGSGDGRKVVFFRKMNVSCSILCLKQISCVPPTRQAQPDALLTCDHHSFVAPMRQLGFYAKKFSTLRNLPVFYMIFEVPFIASKTLYITK